MATIKANHFTGGTALTAVLGNGQGKDSLETILRSIVTDLGTLVAGFEITSPDAVVLDTIASPDAADLASAITLVNEIKAALNDADFDKHVTLVNEIKTALNALNGTTLETVAE